jgi:Flp pilus assembly protein TadD
MFKKALYLIILCKACIFYAQSDLQLSLQADTFFNNGHYKEAIKLYTQAIAVNPKSSKAYFDRAISYYFIKDKKKAIEELRKTVAIVPDSSWPYIFLSTVYRSENKYDSALYYCSKALLKDPHNSDAFNLRGNINKETKKFNDAEADYLNAIKYANGGQDLKLAYTNLGNMYFYAQKNYSKAIECATKAIKGDSTYKEAYLLRARSYDKLKQHKMADNDWVKAYDLKYSPDVIVYDKK